MLSPSAPHIKDVVSLGWSGEGITGMIENESLFIILRLSQWPGSGRGSAI